METTSQLSSKPIENEMFWKHHQEQQQISGLSRVDYCRQHNLNYDRFGYWISKWNRSPDNKLISVKLKSSQEFCPPSLLCTLDLKNGNQLKIHDTKALTILLERYC